MRIIYFIAAAALLAGCRSEKSVQHDGVRPVKCVVARSTRYVDRDFAGLSTADDATNMAFKISGQVKSIPVSKGQAVRRGELLAELDPRDVQLQVEAARASFEQARSRLDRARRLLRMTPYRVRRPRPHRRTIRKPGRYTRMRPTFWPIRVSQLRSTAWSSVLMPMPSREYRRGRRSSGS